MKKLNLIFACLFFLCSCATKEELTKFESVTVGEWGLVEIRSDYQRYKMNSDGEVTLVESYQYCYPETTGNSSGMRTDKLFDEIVEKYWGHTKLIFKNEKEGGSIEGSLMIADMEEELFWRESAGGISITGINLDMIYNGEILSKHIADKGVILCSQDQIIIGMRDISYTTTYIFEKGNF